MDEQIKKVYPLLAKSANQYTQPAGQIDLTGIAYTSTVSVILKELINGERSENEQQELIEYYNKISDKNDKWLKKQKEISVQPQLSTHEIFEKNALLLHDIEISSKMDIIYPISDMIEDYTQLTESGLEMYVYWRSNLRKGVFLDAPVGFMYLYLKEICGIIEHKTPQEAFAYLLKLNDIVTKVDFGRKYESIVKRALKFMVAVYCDKINGVEIYLKEYFYNDSEYEAKKYLLDGNFEESMDYINSNSLYKFKESAFYKKYTAFLTDCLSKIIKEFVILCQKNKFDFLKSSIGYYKELSYEEKCFFPNRGFTYEGKFFLENEYYIRISNGKILETVISRGYKPDDKPEKTKVMFYYLIEYTEKIAREYVGEKRKLNPTFRKLDKLREKEVYRDDLNKLRGIFVSNEFSNMVDRVVEEEYKRMRDRDISKC
jgi:hypothetical protein